MIELPSTSPSPIYFGMRDFKLDGWKENQTAGDTAIYMNMGTAPLGIAGCSVPFFDRIMVQYAFGDGFQLGTAVEGRFNNLYAYRNGGYGIRALSGTDRWFTDCTAGQNVLAGFKATASNGDRFIGRKSWESGKNGPRGVQTIAVVNELAPNWDVAGSNMRLIECEAQDAAAEGFWVNTNNSKLIIHGDANMRSHLQLRDATGNDIELLVGTGTGHGVTSTAAVYIFDAASVNNRIHTTFDSYANMTTSGIVGGTITDKNEIIIGTPNSLFTTAYALTVTPDPIRGYVGITLTGNITIANTLTDRKIPNMEFDVWLTHDAIGGRTVTWGTD